MAKEIFIGLVNNFALLLVLVFIYNRVAFRRFGRNPSVEKVLAGVIMGVLCILLMMNPLVLFGGVLIDSRDVLISISGLFFGPAPTVVLMLITCFYRLFLGGAVGPGIAAIIISGCVGLAWRHFRKKAPNEFSFGELFLFGLVVHVAVFLNLFLLPKDVIVRLFFEITLQTLILFPLGTAFIGKILAGQYEHMRMENTLRRNEAVLNETQRIAKVGGWEYRIVDKQMFWTDEVYHIYGVSREEYDPNAIRENLSFYHPEDRPVLKNAFKQAVEDGTPYDLTLRFNAGNGEALWVRTTADVERVSGKNVRLRGHIMDITLRKEAEKALSESEERFRRALDNLPGVVIIYDPDLRIQYINAATTPITGLTPSDFFGKRESEIWPPEVYEPYMPTLEKALETRTIRSVETALVFPGAGRRYVHITCVPLTDDKGDVREILGITNDFTEQKTAELEHQKLEEQFRQAQKMEAIGRLAGGVAHDFNNLLSIILGYTEMLLETVDVNHPYHENLSEIYNASDRAKNITRQLLAFGRKQVLEIKVFDVNEVVQNLEKMLRRMIGEDIILRIRLSEAPAMVKADVSQLEQVLMNLAVNAKDAMPDGGGLSIRTEITELDENYAAGKAGVVPGTYVKICVSDTGTGIADEDRNYLFEPFFTTKAPDKGTGLGLATVYGIVKQHGGNIHVYSELGHGTTFKLYLPHVAQTEKIQPPSEKSDSEQIPVSATILVVEDDASVRKLACSILSGNGYKVIESESAEDAIRKVREYNGMIHLLLADVIMPTMNGPEVFRAIAEVIPSIKVVYMSGYPGDIITRHGVLDEKLQFIQKPFSKIILLEKISQVLSL